LGGKQDAEIAVPLHYPWQYLMSEGQVSMLWRLRERLGEK